jgi:hypothetical protein
MPRKRNIEKRLGEIAQLVTEWLNKFGAKGEVTVVRERGKDRRLYWGWGRWQEPDAFFIYGDIEIGAFVEERKAIRVNICGDFAEARLFGKTCRLIREGIYLPFSIEFALALYPYFVSFVRWGLVDRCYTYFDCEAKAVVVDGKKGGTAFKIRIEGLEKVSLEINDDLVTVGKADEVFSSLTHLIALLNL